MTKEQLKIWFWDKFNNCYSVKHNNLINHIYMIYDPNFFRAKKLANILNKDFEYPTEIKGFCIFKHSLNNKLLICDYGEIWSFFEQNYSSNYQDIKDLIKDFLVKNKKLKGLSPVPDFNIGDRLLKQTIKINTYLNKD